MSEASLLAENISLINQLHILNGQKIELLQQLEAFDVHMWKLISPLLIELSSAVSSIDPSLEINPDGTIKSAIKLLQEYKKLKEQK